MKNRVKILASAFLLLGTVFLLPKPSEAITICYSTYVPAPAGTGKVIWRCTPSGCHEKWSSEHSDKLFCSITVE